MLSSTFTCSMFMRASVLSMWASVLLVGLLLGAFPSTTHAQSRRTGDVFYGKLGGGISDYTGDFPVGTTTYPLDFQEFSEGSGHPFVVAGEIGYQFSQKWAFALGVQAGNYPIVGYAGIGGISDAFRFAPQLLARYTFGRPSQTVAPYVDLGVNATFGGDSPPTSPGFGPTVGGGVDILLKRRASFFVETRFNATFPDDAVDGAGTKAPFDLTGQLISFGLKVRFEGSSDDTSPSALPASPDDKTASRPITRDSLDTQRQQPEAPRFEKAVQVPSSSFIIGLTDEDPLSLQNAGRKRVTVSSFYIDQYEVTNAEYRSYLSELYPEKRQERLPDSTAWSDARTQASWGVYFRSDYYADYPVAAVTWDEARSYCQAQGMRLPTEAEWEYAARGGNIGRVYPWEGLSTQNEDGEYLANFNPPEGYASDGYAFSAPVDAFPSNDWDLYNVSGNVAEWTGDAYTPSYDNLSDFNPKYRDEDEKRRVIRGGAWNSDAMFIGVGMRDTQREDEASVDIGFRCAQDAVSLNRPGTTQDTTETGNLE